MMWKKEERVHVHAWAKENDRRGMTVDREGLRKARDGAEGTWNETKRSRGDLNGIEMERRQDIAKLKRSSEMERRGRSGAE